MGISGIEWKKKAVIELGEFNRFTILVEAGSNVEIDSALNKFLDQIPDHCMDLFFLVHSQNLTRVWIVKWDPAMSDPIFFQQSALLYNTYHWVQIQIHRPFIPRLGQEPILPFPALTICSNAARKIVHIWETVHVRRDGRMITLEMGPHDILVVSIP